MELTLLLMLMHAAAVAACYFPLNDARFANATLWDEFMANMSDFSGKWATIVGGETAQVWPRDNSVSPAVHTIKYCYADQNAKNTLSRLVEGAAKKW